MRSLHFMPIKYMLTACVRSRTGIYSTCCTNLSHFVNSCSPNNQVRLKVPETGHEVQRNHVRSSRFMFSDMKNAVKSLEKKTVSSLIISQNSLTAKAEIERRFTTDSRSGSTTWAPKPWIIHAPQWHLTIPKFVEFMWLVRFQFDPYPDHAQMKNHQGKTFCCKARFGNFHLCFHGTEQVSTTASVSKFQHEPQ